MLVVDTSKAFLASLYPGFGLIHRKNLTTTFSMLVHFGHLHTKYKFLRYVYCLHDMMVDECAELPMYDLAETVHN